jgi:hypothetical protein
VTPRGLNSEEQGIAAVWTAVILLFLIGVTALAVDTSEFFQKARSQQRAVDLACLAGVVELPGDPALAVEKAADFVRPNQPGLRLIAPGTPTTRIGNTSTWITGSFVFEVETPASYNGSPDPAVMRVSLKQDAPTRFGKVLGADSTGITQQAYCLVSQTSGGPGLLPLGALPNGFSGDLFDCAAKVTGNCGALAPFGTGGSTFRDAVGAGQDGEFEKHHGHETDPDPDTHHIVIPCPETGPCNATDTETGNMVGPFNQGMDDRLANTTDASCTDGNFNCDSLNQVIGGLPETLGAAFPSVAPTWWEPSLYGVFDTYKTQQYYWDGPIAKCDSPRLGTVPIVVYNDNWTIGNPPLNWPNGHKQMKIVGFYTVYIREPDTAAELYGNGLGLTVADVIWFGPSATCDGVPFSPYGSPPVVTGVKLIAG